MYLSIFQYVDKKMQIHFFKDDILLDMNKYNFKTILLLLYNQFKIIQTSKPFKFFHYLLSLKIIKI